MTLKRNVVANFLGQGWSALMGLAFIPWYIHYIGIEAFGLIGFFVAMQAILSLFDMGMTPTLNREMARFTAGAHSTRSIFNLLRSLEVIAVFIGLLICISIWGASSYLASDWLNVGSLSAPMVAQALSIMGLIIGVRFVESIYRSSLFGLQRQVWYNVANAIIATFRNGGVLIVLAYLSPTVQAFFYWQVVISVLSILILASGVYRALPKPHFSPQFSLKAITSVWKFAGGMILISFLAILLTQLDKVILSGLLSLENFAYYTLAATIAGVIYMLIGPITSAIYPRLVELSTQKEKCLLSSLYHDGAQLITVLTTPIAMLLCFFPEHILFMWSGNITLTDNTSPILSIVVLGVFLNGLVHLPAQLQFTYGWVSLGVKSNIVAVVFLIPAMLWAVPLYGAIGAAWVWLGLNLGYVLITIQLMHRRLLINEKWKWYIADVLLPIMGAAGVVMLAIQFQPESYQSRWDNFVFILVTGMLLVMVSILLASKVRLRLIKMGKKYCSP